MLAPRKTLWSTPIEAIDEAISLLQLTTQDTVYDIGAGDGRFLMTCYRRIGCKCVGVEIDAERAAETKKVIQESIFTSAVASTSAGGVDTLNHSFKSFKEEWIDKYHNEVVQRSCNHCGSKRVSTYSRGEPSQDWVDYHNWASEALGFNTHVFGGCTEESNVISRCIDCKSIDVLPGASSTIENPSASLPLSLSSSSLMCDIICANALEVDFSAATAFYLYLVPHGLKRVLPIIRDLSQTRKNIKVVTYMSPFVGVKASKVVKVTPKSQPDAQWPLYFYVFSPDVSDIAECVVSGEALGSLDKIIESSSISSSSSNSSNDNSSSSTGSSIDNTSSTSSSSDPYTEKSA